MMGMQNGECRMENERRAAIRARCDAVPAGPWKCVPNPMRSDGWFVVRDVPPEPYPDAHGLDGKPMMQLPPGVGIGVQMPFNIAEFIACARQDVPGLLAENERLRAALRRIERYAQGRAEFYGMEWYYGNKFKAIAAMAGAALEDTP